MELILVEIAVILLLLIINGIFSMSELAIVSARRIRLQHRADKGSIGAQAALELADNPSRFLSTVQIGITLAGILAGAFGGATIAGILAEKLQTVAALAPYSAAIAFLVVVSVITYFSIVIGELIPKSLALNSPERIASMVSRPMRLISRVSAPVVWLLSTPTSFILKMFKVRAEVEPPVTDEEIKGLIEVGTEAGVFEESEQDIIESVISLEDRRVTSVMTPRKEIAWLDLDDSPERIDEQLSESRFSRLPVGCGSLDNVLGYAATKVLLGDLVKGKQLNLKATVSQPLYVPETLTVLDLLEKFKETQTHFAIVIDEFGGVDGLVTVSDVFGALIGRLPDTLNFRSDVQVVQSSGGGMILDGRLSIPEFKEVLELNEMPAGEQDAYQTLAGFILFRLGRVPEVGEHFRWNEHEFEVVAMDKNRIEKVLVEASSDHSGSSPTSESISHEGEKN